MFDVLVDMLEAKPYPRDKRIYCPVEGCLFKTRSGRRFDRHWRRAHRQ